MRLLIGFILVILLVAVLRVGELYTQLTRYQKYWDRVNENPIGSADLVYVALGDSAAQGVGASKPQNGYVGLIADELAKNQKVQVINFSKSGAKISDVLNTQLPAYEKLKITGKTVITIEIGANDITSYNEQKFESEMDELMKKLPNGTIISDIPSFKGSRLYKLEPRVISANQIMQRLATAQNIELAQLHERVEKNHGIRTFAADIFHPSDYGYRTNWLPAFIAQIQSKNTD